MKLGILHRNTNISAAIWSKLPSIAKWRLLATVDGNLAALTLAQIGEASRWR